MNYCLRKSEKRTERIWILAWAPEWKIENSCVRPAGRIDGLNTLGVPRCSAYLVQCTQYYLPLLLHPSFIVDLLRFLRFYRCEAVRRI